MAQHYTTRSFFRHMPNALLATYFAQRGLFDDLDFESMKETRPDALFAAWLELPEGQRRSMDAEFQDLFSLSCEQGFKAIMDEAQWHFQTKPEQLQALIDRLSELPSHYHRTMVTRLDHPELLKGALCFYHADSLRYWRKRKNMGHAPAAVDAESLDQLAEQMRTYFHHTEGRGNNCTVEPLRRGELDYFFAYPEDYSHQSIEWVNGEFDRRPHNPAFEVIFVYSQKEGTLDLNVRGPKKMVPPLQEMFAATILKTTDLPPDPKDERVYDLDLFARPDIDFVYTIGSGIENVVVRKLRFSSRVNSGDKIILEANTTENPKALRQLMDQIGQSVPLHLYNVTQVELEASVVTDATKPAKKFPIRITYPNSCNLKYDDTDMKLRAMLEASGIEPKLPDETDGADEATES